MSRRHLPYQRPLLATFAAFAVLAGTAAAAPAVPAAPPITPVAATPLATLDDTYYQDALGKTGTQLKSALHSIISVQTKISYSQVWDALKNTDQDPANSSNVILLYTGRSEPKSDNGGAVGQWNREHVWASSTATSAPAPDPAPTSTTCARRTSRSTPSGATRTSTTAVPR